ncbi:MAG: VWA domain-containing protein [Desulfobulbaceae bacterium]|nr:VWA domain-containing protein [Desulfobulbaceae bacterium]
MARRRQLSPFNLAFLDIMFCGFGAVVLLVLLVNAQSVKSRKQQHEDLRAEVNRLEQEVTVGREYLGDLQSSLQESEDQAISIRERIARLEKERNRLVTEMSSSAEQKTARKQQVEALAAALKKMEAEQKRLAEIPKVQGSKVRRFEGEGHRQYLTGLKLGGNRVLILVDGSASMLDTSVVGVLRLRNMDPAIQKNSPKWQQVQKTVRWLVANLPVSSSFQLLVFNTGVWTMAEGKNQNWIPVTGTAAVNGILGRFRDTLPTGGTSLENAFAAAAALMPRPDNIVLLTDGLPTWGGKKPRRKSISGSQRVKFFERAIKRIPAGVPVNTILFPMEGDPMAAVLYWQLAIQTRGSFFTPTSDWP